MDTPKKIVIISRSDATGGAAVVSRRLMEALRGLGADARMLVAEKRCDSPFVELADSAQVIRKTFMAERLKIFCANGFNRSTLFKIDTASDGLPLWNHRWVREADAIILGWVNQGMLSLDGVRRLARQKKPMVWVMHDMWNMTGICHHAGECEGWMRQCGDCPLLGRKASARDLSNKVWSRKKEAYADTDITFVAVSHWLADKAKRSSLLADRRLQVIPNPFLLDESADESISREPCIIFGAQRLDDPIKGLPTFIEATKELRRRDPDNKRGLKVITYGSMRDPDALKDIALDHEHLGVVAGDEAIRRIYNKGMAVVSSSDYETLPGTLVEGQAFGCVPVCFDRGGQSDIVEHKNTGYIARWSPDCKEAGSRLADGVIWALDNQGKDLRNRMRVSVETKFAADKVAGRFIRLLFP